MANKGERKSTQYREFAEKSLDTLMAEVDGMTQDVSAVPSRDPSLVSFQSPAEKETTKLMQKSRAEAGSSVQLSTVRQWN